jgi:hypothetical protein
MQYDYYFWENTKQDTTVPATAYENLSSVF